jgi:virulence factor Mce-like protein
MKLTPRLVANLFTVLLLGVLTVGWVLTSLVGNAVGEDPLSVTADFAGSGGVFTNQEVTYRGVLVGKVGDLSLNEDGVDIELLIDPGWKQRIPSDLHASIQSKSAVGEQFVNLTPNTSGPEMLQDGDRIDRSATSLPVDFQQLLRSLDRVLADVPPETARRLVENLGGGLKGRGEDIASILNSLARLSDAFASIAPEQQRLLTNATSTGTAFLASKEEFTAAIEAADEVFAGLGDEPAELKRLFAQNDRLARTGIKLLAKHGDRLEGGFDALADLVNWQLRTREDQIASLELLPGFLHAIEDASIPWRSPDGREFYRIRTGLVLHNDPATWPCKYENEVGFETRLPHERDERPVPTGLPCLPQTTTSTTVNVTPLVDALERWAAQYGADGAADDPLRQGTGEGPFDEGPGGGAELPPAIVDETLTWPLEGFVSVGFGALGPNGEPHDGLDITGEVGSPVRAAASGLVTYVGEDTHYGHTIVIQHGPDLVTVYAHLAATEVLFGQEVAQGDQIGQVGCSGVCDTPHLHFEVRREGEPIDPLTMLPPSLLFGIAGGLGTTVGP